MTNPPLSTDVRQELTRLGGTIPEDFEPRGDLVVPTPVGERHLPRAVQELLAVEWPAGHVLLRKEKVGYIDKAVLSWELYFPAPAPIEPGFTDSEDTEAWFTIGHDWRGFRLVIDLDDERFADNPVVYRFDTDGLWGSRRALSVYLGRVTAQRPAVRKNALARAAARGDVATALTLINGGASVGPVNANGVTPLHMAALTSESAEMVRLLVDAGADVNAAVTATEPVRLTAIIESGRLAGRELGPGETPLGVALQGGGPKGRGRPVTAEVVAELLRLGADPNVHDSEGRTPLHRACHVYREEEMPVVAMLLAAGAEPDPPTGPRSPLYEAMGAYRIVDLLLKAGADPCRPTDGGYWGASGLTPLHMNARHDTHESLRLMVEAATDVNVRNPEGVTPLHFAAVELEVESMRVLLEAGADPDAVMHAGTPFATKYGPDLRTPLDIARKRGRRDAVALMEKYA